MSSRMIICSPICSRLERVTNSPCNALLAKKNVRLLGTTTKIEIEPEKVNCSDHTTASSFFQKFRIHRPVPNSNTFSIPIGSQRMLTSQVNATATASVFSPLIETRRFYAKGRDKVKSKNTKVVVDENEIGQLVDVRALKAQLELQLTEMKDEFAKTLTLRGAGHLETLEVEFDGQTYPLQELGQVGRKNPQMAVVNLSSLPEACQAVMRAIQESGMNVNPQQEGTTIFVPLPKVTREHRETLAKNAKALFTKYKVFLQGVQNKFIKEGKRQSDMSEDLVYSVQQQIMKLTDSYIAEAEKLMLTKQKELLDTK